MCDPTGRRQGDHGPVRARRRPMVRGARLRALAVACALAVGGCSHLGAPSCSGGNADLAASGRRDLHVRMELTRDGMTRRYEVAVQAEPGRITAIGLTPMGTPAFRVTHDRDGVGSENRIGRYLGYTPVRAYDAIVQALLARAPAPGDAPTAVVVAGEPGDILVENPRCGYSARLVVISDERASLVSPN